ncbi:MAG: TonB-dependent receptor P39 [Bacteroides sp.]
MPAAGYAESVDIPVNLKTDITQQKELVTGTVVDKDGFPLVGVNIMDSPVNGTVTDIDGNFSIQVSPSSKLSISYIGYVTQTVEVKRQKHLQIVLLENSELLEEVVVVGYGSQKKVSVTGAVASVQTKELKQSSSANLSNALAGRLPGLTAIQTSGQPGKDDVTLYLRGASTTNGSSPLIMIDGVPRDNISSLDPNEIASVSILKDASATAVFGVRGANGVIMITTRRGEVGKQELNITADYSIQSFITRPDRIHSWEFAELRNQAARNSGTSEENLPYSPYMIEKYRSGDDPVFYPDRDPYEAIFRKWAPQFRVNMNLNGGTEKLRYFVNAAYLGQGGQLKTESKDKLGYDPSFKMDRYNFRVNLDYQIAKNLKASVNVATYLEKMNSPQLRDLYGGSMDAMVTDMLHMTWATPPTDPGPLTMEGYGVPSDQVIAQMGTSDRNIYGDLNRRGYRQETNTNLNTSLVLDWGLDFITKGLSTKLMLSYDARAKTAMDGVRGLDMYGAVVARNASEKNHYKEIRVNQANTINLSKSMGSNYYMNIQYSLNYARQFGRHDITAMALLQRDNWQKWDGDLPYNMLGLSARATYAYDSRYLLEANIGYNGSEQFAKGKRFGFFPAFSAGWVISNEGFLAENKVITNLKLRASYGKVGNDKLGSARFLYISNISQSGGFISSLGRGNQIVQGRLGNPNLSWEIAYKQNYGMDIQLFRELSLSVDYFVEKRSGVLISRGTVPEIQGVELGNLPKVNMGKIDNKGFEMELSYNKTINKDLSFTVKGNFAYNKNVQKFMDEAMYSDQYAYRYRQTGFSIGQNFGYLIDTSNGNGYINSQEELDKLPVYQIGTPRIGDFKYVDLNGDGYINEKDMAPIGYSDIPRITYGFSGSVSYKGFDFSVLFSGIGQASRLYQGGGVWEYSLAGFYSGYHLKAWTPERYENGEDILYPALGTSRGTSQVANSFFIMDRSFLRMKNIELGYTFPKDLLKRVSINNLRLFISGNNLLTWSKLPVNTIDPEQSAALSYPITKMVNFGLNVSF